MNLADVTREVNIDRIDTAKLGRLNADNLDLIHVDGDHSETGTARDIELAWPALRAGGVLVIDDFGIPVVRRAVSQLCDNRDLTYRQLPTFRGAAVTVKPCEK
jgi:predicted O-methyltransferase YrrM